jgi:hypothetical protein
VEWIVRVGWRPDGEVDLNEVITQMTAYNPNIDVEADGTWTVKVTLDAPTLRLAVADALHHVERATGARATGIEARPAEELVWTGG